MMEAADRVDHEIEVATTARARVAQHSRQLADKYDAESLRGENRDYYRGKRDALRELATRLEREQA